MTIIGSFVEASSPEHDSHQCTTQIEVSGTIGPATVDYFERTLEKNKKWGCQSILVLINTPGGSLQSTRLIVESILNSEVPILCLVSPSGGHAGSAGAIILQACHVSGAVTATNIGAATPVSGMGDQMPEDLRKKILNDTISWIEGLTRLRQRSKKFGEEIVTEAKALDAHEALKQGAIDAVVHDRSEFLTFAQGREVVLNSSRKGVVGTGPLRIFGPDLRYTVVDFLTDPQFAYLLFMGSLALLYFEITHPGVIVPGVAGAMGLIVSLISFHKLNVTWGGLALILLGLILMVTEAFVPSFGALGIGGAVSFLVGSLFLFDIEKSGYTIPLVTILPTVLICAGAMLGLAWLAFSTRGLKRSGTTADLIGETAVVTAFESTPDGTKGFIELKGETWKFHSKQDLKRNDRVRIIHHKGLLLEVEKS